MIIKFGTTELETTVNQASNHRNVFAANILWDPYTTIITVTNTTIDHPDQFHIGTDYVQELKVINDQKSKLFLFHSS